MRNQARGFTLIELMVVVAVIAILAAIALPSFREQVRKSRRSEAMSQMGSVQLALERWRADHPSYANTSPASPTYPALPASPHYTFSLSSVTATGYTLTATPTGGQAGDRCGVLTSTASTKPHWANDNCP